MTESHTNNPLHGITLERMLNELVEHLGWERMSRRVSIACFTSDPSISSSLKFLRKTPWARAKVDAMYLDMVARKAKHDLARLKQPTSSEEPPTE